MSERVGHRVGHNDHARARGARIHSGPLTLGILISGRGSNMVSIAESCLGETFPAEVGLVLSNVPDAPGLEKARSLGVDTATVDHRDFDDREAFEGELIRVLEGREVELVCLAGFMRVLSPRFVRHFGDRILNIHPSLLPAFPGLEVQREAIEYGVRYSGCTVHFVTEEVDAGPIVLQAVVPVEPDDTPDRLAARILKEEHRIYPQSVGLFAEDRLRIQGRRVEILPKDES